MEDKILPGGYVMKTMVTGMGERGQSLGDLSIFQQIEEAVVLLDGDHRIIFWNRGAEKYFELDGTRVAGRIIDEVFVQENQKQAVRSIRDGPRQQVLEFPLSNGRIKWLQISCYTESERSDGLPGMLILACDVSDLVAGQRRAEQGNLAKSEFLAHISHEIRTPLLGILGYGDILKRDHSGYDTRECIDTIYHCAYQLLGLVNNVLDLSSIEARKMEVIAKPFDVRTMIKKTIASLAPGTMQKGVELKLHIDKRVPEMLSGDEVKIRQVLTNLLFNAIKYTDQGEINVSVQADAYQTETDARMVILCISVSDTGIGIEIEKMEEIFRPYTRLEYNQPGFGGAGLGLAISRQLVGLMGGAIWCDHNDKGGAVFSFTIPLMQITAEFVMENDEPYITLAPENMQHANPLVMVVEDIPVNRKIIVSMLEEMGCKVIAAANGQECLRVLGECSPDLILMDMQMPVLDGYAATAIIKENKSWGNIPVIALTAYALSSDIEKCLQAGCNYYLSKPFSKDQLYNAVKRFGTAGNRVS